MPCVDDEFMIRDSPRKRLAFRYFLRSRYIWPNDGRIAKVLFWENAPADDETFHKLSDILLNDVTGGLPAGIGHTIGKKGRWNLAKMLPSEVLEMEQEFFDIETEVASVSYAHMQELRINGYFSESCPIVTDRFFPWRRRRTKFDRMVIIQDGETKDFTGKFYLPQEFIKKSETEVPRIHVQYVITDFGSTMNLDNSEKFKSIFTCLQHWRPGKKGAKEKSAQLMKDWRKEQQLNEVEDIVPDFLINYSASWDNECDENDEKESSTRKEFTLADFIAGEMIPKRIKKPISDWVFVTDMK